MFDEIMKAEEGEMAAVLAAVLAYMESEGGPARRPTSRWREAGRAELMATLPLRQPRQWELISQGQRPGKPGFPGIRKRRHG